MDSPELVTYYRRRAAEYEQIYAKPERQADLSVLRRVIPHAMRGRRVLEIACGTGYWTTLIAKEARSVVAVDLAEEPMGLARAKPYPEGNVAFHSVDAYALPSALGSFDGAYAGFWWSHVPRQRVGEFLASLHARLEPGAKVLLMDNRYVEGSSTPIAETDADGNTYQHRRLADGSLNRVLKNFPTEEELRRQLPGARVTLLEYYWLAEYDAPGSRL
ncbi:MAG TPA: methyltransferase domain-containing protein [Burkholderiales bacterium]|nr:methyltransferase domain-containing protein [Burkholderiales bacterium]